MKTKLTNTLIAVAIAVLVLSAATKAGTTGHVMTQSVETTLQLNIAR